MKHTHESYQRSECCDEDCWSLDSLDLCWGEVVVVDEMLIEDEDGNIVDSWYVFACEGHEDTKAYKRLPEEQGVGGSIPSGPTN